MQRLVVLPPNVPEVAVTALRSAVARLNQDKEYIADAVKSLGFVPEWQSGPMVNKQVRQALSAKPGMREFIADYVKKAKRK
jgi:hypothetical protein